VRVSPGSAGPKVKLLGYVERSFPQALRAQALRVMEGAAMTAAEFSRLNWSLGKLYADSIESAVAEVGVKVTLVGLHGQTIFHDPGKATWQTGEAAVIREQLGVPVVSNFRPADVAAGGQGAPLVPMLDWVLFKSPAKNRVLLNLGGIANVTAIPAGAGLDGIMAFDTGPANMVIDWLMQDGFGKKYDRDGKVAAKGKVLPAVVAELMQSPYFSAAPPKSSGREQYGAAFAEKFKAMCLKAGGSERDAVATATEFTAATVLDGYVRFCWAHLGQRAPLARATELIVGGGGVKNATLMRGLSAMFGALGVQVVTSDTFGVPSQAKEAMAFALLAWLSRNGMPGNVATATGAAGPRVLGQVTC
jgi:anhydro-N-acetylmuramic acid kinase